MMKKFRFRAKNWSGATIKGLLEVDNRQAALEVLHANKLMPLSVDRADTNIISETFSSFFGKASSKQLANFTRQLATMMNAGLALTDALQLLASQTQGQAGMLQIIEHCLTTVRGGQSLAVAMERYSGMFGEAFIASIRAGESGGVLEEILNRLAINMEKDQEFRSKVKGAMIYPMVVITGIIGVVFVLLIFVVPKLTGLYKDFGAKLPAITQFVMDVSALAQQFWFMFPILFFGLMVFMKFVDSRAELRYRRDKIILKLPVMGELVAKSAVANVCRTLSMLLGAGVPLTEALSIVIRVAESEVYTRALERITSRVEKGFSLSDCFAETEVFPTLVNQMVATGEATGKLDEVLMRVADYFSKEAEESVKGLTSAIEPLIMVMLGGVVGFMIVAVIMPIYDLTSQF